MCFRLIYISDHLGPRRHRGHRTELRLGLPGSFGYSLTAALPSSNNGRANDPMAEEGLATKKHLMVIGADIITFRAETSETPKIELATEGSILGMIKELWKDVLSKLLKVMNSETPAVRLP